MFRYLLMGSAFRIIPREGEGGGGGGGGGADVGSFGTLDAGLQKTVTDNGWKAPADAVKNYAALVSKMGGMISLPTDKSTPEEIAAYRAKRGVPADPTKYDLAGFKKPDGISWDDEAQGMALKTMHQLGLNNAEALGVLGIHAEIAKGAMQKIDARAAEVNKAAEPALRKAWGDKYDENYKAANLAVRKIFGTDLEGAKKVRLLDGSYLLDNANLAQVMAQLGGGMSEDGDLIGNKGGGGNNAPEDISTAATAQAFIEKTRSEATRDPKHPYLNPNDPQHDALHKKMLLAHGVVAAANGGQAE